MVFFLLDLPSETKAPEHKEAIMIHFGIVTRGGQEWIARNKEGDPFLPLGECRFCGLFSKQRTSKNVKSPNDNICKTVIVVLQNLIFQVAL